MNWPQNDDEIVGMIFAHEGSDYTDLPSDKGGPTKYGITIDTLSSWRHSECTSEDVKNLTEQEATEIYKGKYIIHPGFDTISDVRLRAALVDMGVMFGYIRAIQTLQSLVHVSQDGVLGPLTQSAANYTHDIRGLINQISGVRIQMHAKRVNQDHTQLAFLTGWINRALSFVE